jgi:hypothetical protein
VYGKHHCQGPWPRSYGDSNGVTTSGAPSDASCVQGSGVTIGESDRSPYVALVRTAPVRLAPRTAGR